MNFFSALFWVLQGITFTALIIIILITVHHNASVCVARIVWKTVIPWRCVPPKRWPLISSLLLIYFFFIFDIIHSEETRLGATAGALTVTVGGRSRFPLYRRIKPGHEMHVTFKKKPLSAEGWSMTRANAAVCKWGFIRLKNFYCCPLAQRPVEYFLYASRTKKKKKHRHVVCKWDCTPYQQYHL